MISERAQAALAARNEGLKKAVELYLTAGGEHVPAGWGPPDNIDPKAGPRPEDFRRLIQWMSALCAWGRHVRADIVRLELATGITPGDPGDPPSEPWSGG